MKRIKKIFSFLLIGIMMLQVPFVGIVFGAENLIETSGTSTTVTEKKPDGVLVETSSKIKTDFTNNVPTELKSNIIRVDGESVYRLDGKNNIVAGNTVGSIARNSYVSADVKLVKSTGVSSGAFSLATFSGGANSTMVRFAYVSAIKYNPDTKMGDGTETIFDRIAIVSTGSASVNRWTYGAISDHELGIQSSAKETPWIRLKGISVGGMYYLSAYDAEGNLLDSLSISHDELMGENANAVGKSGGFQVTSNSCEVLVDNLSCGEVELIDNPTFKFNTRTAKINTPVGCKLTSADGTELPTDGYEMVFDETKAERDENGEFIFHELGTHEVKLLIYDASAGENLECSASIEIKDNIEYESIEVSSAKDKVYKGENVGIEVIGIDNIGDRFKIPSSEYTIIEPAGQSGESVVFAESGNKKIKVEAHGKSDDTDIFVSRYSSLTPALSLTTVEQKSTVTYSMTANENGTTRTMGAGEYTVTADKAGLIINEGNIFADKTGEFILSFTADSMTEMLKFTVNERSNGLIIDEDFESASNDNEYFVYPEDHIVSDGRNHVLRYADEESGLFGGESWKHYKISAKVKIATPVLDEKSDYATFEIKPNTRVNNDVSTLGGTWGIPCIYRIDHKIDSGSHMRIGPAVGANINIEDGRYHDFSIEVYATQAIFEIDGVRQYYNLSTSDTGYFTFMANNCEVYIDDVKVSKDTTAWGKPISQLRTAENIVDVNAYEPWQFRAINAYILDYNDGSYAYATNWANSYSYAEDKANTIEFEQVDGFEYGNVLRKNTIQFKKDAPDGAIITVKARYNEHECLFKVRAKRPAQEYVDYIKERADIHRESYAFRLVYGYNKGLSNTAPQSSTLSHRMAVMTIYPKIRDYSSMIEWYAKAADYQEKQVGRGTDAGDFIVVQGMASYIKHRGHVKASEEAWNTWKDYMLKYEWVYPNQNMSENHTMIYYCCAILAGETWPDEKMYDGKTGEETAREQSDYLIDWYNLRVDRGIMEYDSCNYYNVNLFGSEMMYTAVKNKKLKQLAYDYITLIYADVLPDALEESLTGSHLRSYHQVDAGMQLKSLSFNFNSSTYMVDEFYQMNVQEGEYVLNDYVPPAALFEIAADDTRRIENNERHSIYTLVDDRQVTESLNKYTYRTPEYAMGSKIYQDDLSKYDNTNGALYANTDTWKNPVPVLESYQATEWSMHFGKGTDSWISENHPGTSGGHSDFYGDQACNCTMYYQHLGASMGMHKITKAGKNQYTHFYIPTERFQKVEERDGWIFIEHFGVFGAIKPMKDGVTTGTMYEWGSSEQKYGSLLRSKCEAIINSPNTAFVAEITSQTDFGGDFEAFKARVIENGANIVYSVTGDNYSLEYTSLAGEKLKLDYNNNLRFLNDEQIDFSESKLFDNPYVQSDWESGAINIKGKNSTYTIKRSSHELYANDAETITKAIKKLREKLEYEEKFGRGEMALAANKAEIENLSEKLGLYSESYLLTVAETEYKRLLETVNRIYKKSGSATRDNMKDTVLNANTATEPTNSKQGEYENDKKTTGCGCSGCINCNCCTSCNSKNAD